MGKEKDELRRQGRLNDSVNVLVTGGVCQVIEERGWNREWGAFRHQAMVRGRWAPRGKTVRGCRQTLDNSGVPVMDVEAVRAALRAHNPTALLELPEGQWLDAKSAPYELRSPSQVEELAKDVAAFANGGGGVIVVGISTRPEGAGEVLDKVGSVDRSSVNLDQWRKLIREHITPAPRGTSVEWSDDGQGACVVYIDIPAQDPGCLFVVAAPTGKQGAARPDTVAVPVREADGTYWLPRTEIQRLLSNAVAVSGMSTAKTLTELLHDALAQARLAPAPPGPQVGQGGSSRRHEIREAYEQLRPVGLGRPAGEAYLRGPAVIQEFEASEEGACGWVLCVLEGRAPVAVAAPVWRAIRAAGAGGSGHPLALVGFPVPGSDRVDHPGPWVVAPDARSVELDGGSWKAGRLVRSGRGVWRWEPAERFDFTMSRYARNWTAQQPAPQLRLRALVSWPWADAGGLQITPEGRLELGRALPYSPLAGAVTLLSRRRGAELPAQHWGMGPWRNTPAAASYTSLISVPDGRRALSGSAMISVEDTMVVTCAEILIEDPVAWAAALPADAETQLDLGEVQALLLAAWETAAETLSDAVTDPARMRWAAPPTTELRLSAEGPHDQPSPGLGALIDLDALGPGESGVRPEMAITITRSPTMQRQEPQALLRRALVHMARHFGHVWADEELL
ncbi:RNA-binding domain-containing protein [Streptomyces collinus]|uniref:RNA-binding domain-containing protein n=1 Tax=Streptomyces collinus TaxID=42684 RepID=UPI0033241BAD